MPGLYLGGMGGARVVGGGSGMSAMPVPSTASQAAFGAGASGGRYPSTVSAIAPNDPFGVALWMAIAAGGLLLFIRHSLPA